MEDLHFENMVQYEAKLKNDKNMTISINNKLSELCYNGPNQRKSSEPGYRVSQTIEHDAIATEPHHSYSIEVTPNNGQAF